MNSASWQSLLDQAATWVWTTSLHGSVLIGLVLAMRKLAGAHLPIRGRYLLGMLVLIRLLLPGVPQSRFSIFNLAMDPVQPEPSAPVIAEADPGSVQDVPRPSSISDSSLSITPARPFPWRTIGQMLWLLGAGAILAKVFQQQRAFSKLVRGCQPVDQRRLRRALDQAQTLLGLERRVELISGVNVATPAVFGWWTPRILFPERLLAHLDDRELRLVLLHELTHIQRRDVLLNWLMIVIRAAHWFNPLVWLAFRRLQADRELLCDAIVLRVLSGDDQRAYGHTLLKLLDTCGPSSWVPAFVPVMNHKHEVKRRIIMISEFKSLSRSSWILTAGLIAIIGCLAFTRAADRTLQTPAPQEPTVSAVSPKPAEPSPAALTGLEYLERRLEAQRIRATEAQAKVDVMRRDLGIREESFPVSGLTSLDPDTIRLLEHERISAETQCAKYEALHHELTAKNREQLRQTLPTTLPDTLLTSLLDRLSSVETEVAKLSTEQGPNSPPMRALASAAKNLNQQIDARVEGILAGLASQLAASKATLERLRKIIESTRKEDAQLAERYRPYLTAKRDSDTEQRVYETLKLRVLQEKIDAQFPKYVKPPTP